MVPRCPRSLLTPVDLKWLKSTRWLNLAVGQMAVDGACRSLKLDGIVTIQQRNSRASSEKSNCSGLDVEKQSRSPVTAELFS